MSITGTSNVRSIPTFSVLISIIGSFVLRPQGLPAMIPGSVSPGLGWLGGVARSWNTSGSAWQLGLMSPPGSRKRGLRVVVD
jgi:hypothetical protein